MHQQTPDPQRYGSSWRDMPACLFLCFRSLYVPVSSVALYIDLLRPS